MDEMETSLTDFTQERCVKLITPKLNYILSTFPLSAVIFLQEAV